MPITKPNEQRKLQSNDFTWEQFAKDCLLNKYVLIVGNEAVLNRNINPEAEGDSMKLLFNLTLRYKAKLDVRNGNDEDEIYRYLKSRINNFTDLVREYNYHNVREWVQKTIENNDFKSCFDDEIEPSLMQLLQTQCFRIVLTTSIDPYLEIAMDKVWDGNFKIVQIENAQQLYKQIAQDEFGGTIPTLCYVFGKISPEKTLSENRFVLSENDAMEKISHWFESNKNNKFLEYIRNFRLLSVGCQFDDWMFRFFWFLLRGRVSTEADGQVAVEIKDEGKLKQYLENEKVKVFPNARLFMHDAKEYLDRATDLDRLPRKGNGVFISYAHKDRYLAIPLFERLNASGINVWIDEDKNKPGDPYEPRIYNAIASCKIFMPILSTQIKYDLLTNQCGWYEKEWHKAQERYESMKNISGNADFSVIPIVIDDYSFNESYHQKLPQCILGASAFEPAKENIESLIHRINHINEK